MSSSVKTHRRHVVQTSGPCTSPTSRSRSARRKRKKFVTVLRLMLALLFIGGLCLALLPRGRAIARASLLLPALLSGSEPAPLVWVGESIRHTQETVPSRSGTVYLDIYAPTTSRPLISAGRGGVLIVPGVGDNRTVPQLVNLSQAMARTGLTVMDMTTPTLMNYDLTVQDEDAVVQAFNTLSKLPGMQGKRVGIVAFSAGVPIASFAAADPRIRDRVASLVTFGGYFNTESVVRAFGRRAIDIDGHTERWQPTEVPVQTLANVLTKPLEPAERLQIVHALAPDGKPLSANELSRLSPDAQAAYHLLIGDAPDRVAQNMAALSPAIHGGLADLSPSRVIAQIRAPIFLLHDRNDSSIPVTESRAFAAALARLNHPHEYVEFHIFDHVEMRSNPNIGQMIGDGSRLFGILSDMLYADEE